MSIEVSLQKDIVDYINIVSVLASSLFTLLLAFSTMQLGRATREIVSVTAKIEIEKRKRDVAAIENYLTTLLVHNVDILNHIADMQKDADFCFFPMHLKMWIKIIDNIENIMTRENIQNSMSENQYLAIYNFSLVSSVIRDEMVNRGIPVKTIMDKLLDKSSMDNGDLEVMKNLKKILISKALVLIPSLEAVTHELLDHKYEKDIQNIKAKFATFSS